MGIGISKNIQHNLQHVNIYIYFSHFRTWVFGPPSRSRYALIFFVLAIVLWGYPMYYYKVMYIIYYIILHVCICKGPYKVMSLSS